MRGTFMVNGAEVTTQAEKDILKIIEDSGNLIAMTGNTNYALTSLDYPGGLDPVNIFNTEVVGQESIETGLTYGFNRIFLPKYMSIDIDANGNSNVASYFKEKDTIIVMPNLNYERPEEVDYVETPEEYTTRLESHIDRLYGNSTYRRQQDDRFDKFYDRLIDNDKKHSFIAHMAMDNLESMIGSMYLQIPFKHVLRITLLWI